ncbi:MAG: SAM-dependent methyltransferase [Cyanobium sp.]|uniref:class I SAM-dependent methyltransferase n=1 Tax=Synechococcus sp. CS-1333 TaxID=2848638 RepID=UPI000DBBB476|nr:class I SAM-dependent methyltransferase [Synechococcus sp. CS-1333]PZV19976.1 MAG: SAM-dependent methyltransferase [Cyanobium sp.]
MEVDRSNGWEAVAARFVAERSSIGAATVRSWSRALPASPSVLDLGCGCGVPISAALMAEGCHVSAVDASPSMVAAYRQRFPQARVACEPVEKSSFFNSTFHGIVAVGLLFLLPADGQRALIRRVSAALQPGGRFLFTAPVQAVAWKDTMMGGHCVSLGDEVYRRALAAAGLHVVGEFVDEGENHYYDACRMG